jgi:signal transduction histidine kinase/HD-like signal output (HDOD) protein
MSLVREPSLEVRHQGRASLVLHEIRGIPAPPPATIRLIEYALGDRHSVTELAALIRENPALTVPMLSEAFEGPWESCPSATIAAYVEQLGVARVLETSLAILVMDALSGPISPTAGGLDHRAFWRHCFAVACTARTIAHEINEPRLAMAAFVASLLHDVGKIALDLCYPKSYRRVIHLAETAGRCICDAEREVLGIDHTLVGKRLATAWNLPAPIADCAWLHHYPSYALPAGLTQLRLVGVVNLADNLVRRLHVGFSGYSHLDLDAAGRGMLDIPHETLNRIECGIVAESDSFAVLTRLNEVRDDAPQRQARNSRMGIDADRSPQYPNSDFRTSPCAVAVSRLTRKLRGNEDVSSVCRDIAETMCAAFDLPAAVAFAVPRLGCHCAVGVCVDGILSNDVVPLWDFDKSPATETSHEPLPSGNRLTHRPERFAAIEERFERLLVGADRKDVIRVFQIVHQGQMVGAVMFAAGVARSKLDDVAPDQLETLSLVFGWAVAGATGREEIEQAAETALSSHRRRHVEPPAETHEASLAMIAQMAAGAAHELNNPLAVIAGRAQMLRRDVQDPASERHLDIIDEQARRASDIVSELMRFAKPDPPRPEAISVQAWAQRLRQYWYQRSNLAPEQIVVSVPDEAIQMYADAAQLDEAAGAIIANAIEATTPENAILHINSLSLVSDDTIVVSIGDNGRGMSPEVLKHACDPFFSHRPAGRGRGLGLSRAARLIENNGGRLKIESRPGAGAKVSLTMPAPPRSSRREHRASG